MKSIKTLIQDVYDVIGREPWFDEPQFAGYLGQLGRGLHSSLTQAHTGGTLRLSAMGDRCPRSLWASVHTPSVQEVIKPWTKFKFHYGHFIEASALGLARVAGHSVEGEQDELFVDGIAGHRDCVLDGCIVDVKSTDKLSFQKIKSGDVEEDIFLRSYLDQLDGYVVGSYDDPLVTEKELAYIWAIDKVQGHMCLYEHRVRPNRIKQRVADYKAIVECKEPPACTCQTMQERNTGNIRLDTKASYNPYKHFCKPNLRTFITPKGPIYYTYVRQKPDNSYEVNKEGFTLH